MKRLLLSIAVMISATVVTNSQVVYTSFENNPVTVSEREINFFGGEAEFMIQDYSAYGEAIYFACFTSGAAVVSTAADYNANVTKLSAGSTVSQNSTFFGFDNTQSPYFNILHLPNTYESWLGSGVGYVGIKFKNGNNVHYGWVKLEITSSGVLLYGYAYQSTPNTAITVGDTGGNLAIGAEIENGFSVYPNPVKNTLNIETNNNINKISIINLQGQEVKNTSDKQIDVADLENGVYFLNIFSDKGFMNKRFVKQ